MPFTTASALHIYGYDTHRLAIRMRYSSIPYVAYAIRPSRLFGDGLYERYDTPIRCSFAHMLRHDAIPCGAHTIRPLRYTRTMLIYPYVTARCDLADAIRIRCDHTYRLDANDRYAHTLLTICPVHDAITIRTRCTSRRLASLTPERLRCARTSIFKRLHESPADAMRYVIHLCDSSDATCTLYHATSAGLTCRGREAELGAYAIHHTHTLEPVSFGGVN